MAINTPPTDQVIQWALQDILDHKQQPSPDILAMIEPGSEASNIIASLCSVLDDSNGEGFKHAFMALCKKHPWLGELKSKPVPPRPGSITTKPLPPRPQVTAGVGKGNPRPQLVKKPMASDPDMDML